MAVAEILGAILILVTVFCVATFGQWAYKRRKLHGVFVRAGIPGPKPRLFTGNLSELAAEQIPDLAISKWIHRYGKVFGYFTANQPTLVISDVDLLKQVMIKESHLFVNRPRLPVESKPFVDQLVFLRDNRWKNVRNIITPVFTASKMRQMANLVNQATDQMMEVIAEHARKDEPFDIYSDIQALTLDIIAECALAMKTNCQKDSSDQLLTTVKKFFSAGPSRLTRLLMSLPFLIPLLKPLRKLSERDSMLSFVLKRLNYVIKVRQENAGERAVDLLQVLIDCADNREGKSKTDPSKKTLLSKDEIVANALMFLFAGYETSATALAFVSHLLIKHQDVQEKLYNEVVQALGDKLQPSYDDVNNLTYLDQVLSETLRLYPPAALVVARECAEDCTINGQFIPGGVSVLAPVYHIHHDPQYWERPDEFDPERFSPVNKKNINPSAYLPFGIGPRNCIGMRFALLEAKLALAKLIRSFRLVACERTRDLRIECPAVIMRPVGGVHAKAVPR